MDAVKNALDKAKIALMNRPDSAFFTTVCFSLKHQFDTSIPTACTNGKTIRYNPDFFMELDEQERLFLLLHETLHVCFMHMVRLGSRTNRRKWNIAADYVINQILKDRGYRVIKGALIDSQYKDMSTEQVYALLPDDPEVPGAFVMDDLEEPEDGDSDSGGGGSSGLESEISDILIRAQIQSKLAGDSTGTIPGEIEIFINNLLSPRLPWHRILRKFMNRFNKTDYSFRFPNRRFLPDLYLPSMYNEAVGEIAMAVDTSGSVTDEDFQQFVSEAYSILNHLQPEAIQLIQFDTVIQSVDTVRNARDLKNVSFTGRGGTMIAPVLEWACENKPQVLLVLTDGYFRFLNTRTPPCPVVWVIHNNTNFDPPFGKVIHYELDS